ncbi:hypothetical protein EYF80_001826 [Liparis tanakae]|uniref:Uncharacterized protein n=1 Tax=Liparis tanakae TaxID=230148 RepID=A0A4Z2JF11_9TELE|nr:hypothetical protein EYF80_001826 [Liparis tanakae]
MQLSTVKYSRGSDSSPLLPDYPRANTPSTWLVAVAIKILLMNHITETRRSLQQRYSSAVSRQMCFDII